MLFHQKDGCFQKCLEMRGLHEVDGVKIWTNMDFTFMYIDLANVRSISRGDPVKLKKYVNQFEELLTERLKLLTQAQEEKDRVQIRQIAHKMFPQLKFFGVQGISFPIERLELEYETMNWIDLNKLVDLIIFKLSSALQEVQEFTQKHLD